jgi:hypothetical protein
MFDGIEIDFSGYEYCPGEWVDFSIVLSFIIVLLNE